MRNEANKTIIKFDRNETPPKFQFHELGVLDGFYYAGSAYIKISVGYAIRLCNMKETPFGLEAEVVPRQLTITVS